MLRKFFKLTFGLTLFAVLTFSLFVYYEWNFRPVFINNFFNRSIVHMALDSPETLSTLRILDQFGIKGHNQKLDDSSLEHMEELYTKVEEMQRVLRSYNNQDLNDSEKISKQVADELMSYFLNSRKFRFHNYPLNQIWGVQLNLPTFLATKHVIETASDAQNYLLRLKQVRVKVDQVMEGLLIREEKGILPPRFIGEKVIAGLESFIGTPAHQKIFYASHFLIALDKPMVPLIRNRNF